MKCLTSILLILAGACFGSAEQKISVDGEGFFRLQREGRAVYAKEVQLTVLNQTLLGNGLIFLPSIHVSSADVSVDLEGNVSFHGGSIGRLVLASFESETPQPQGQFLIASSRPKLGNPGEGTFGVVRSNAPATKATPPASKPSERAQTINSSSKGVRIELCENVFVDSERVSLGDVATIQAPSDTRSKLEAIVVGECPPFGAIRKIDRDKVIQRIRLAGLKPENYVILGETPAVVTRKGQTIAQSRFDDLAIQECKKRLGEAYGFKPTDTDKDFNAPTGELSFRVESVSPQSSTNLTAVVAVLVDGKRYNSRTVHLDVEAPAAGVKANDLVDVILTKNGVTVKVKGRVKKTVPLGGTVEVAVNLGTKETDSIQLGTVTAPGVVEVKL